MAKSTDNPACADSNPGLFRADVPIFSVEGLSFAWDDNKKILEDINFALFRGQNTGLYGANGSGKTTFFRCVTGLLRPCAGIVRLGKKPMRNEKDFVQLRRKVGLALQDAGDQIFFPTVLEDVAFGPLNLGLSLEDARARAKESLELTGLVNYEDKLSYNLSGGEQRLAALAGILAMRPDALLLDEPMTGLDEKARARVTEVVKNLSCAKVVVAHDRDFLENVCADIMLLKDGRMAMLA